jgi:hypothetical protein
MALPTTIDRVEVKFKRRLDNTFKRRPEDRNKMKSVPLVIIWQFNGQVHTRNGKLINDGADVKFNWQQQVVVVPNPQHRKAAKL